MQFDFPYRAHVSFLQRELAASVFDQPPSGDHTAFFEAALLIVWQLSALEAGLEDQGLAPAVLLATVGQPFVLGYIFGAAAAAIERHGADRHSPAATSVRVTLTQVVVRGGTFDESVALHNAATADQCYAEAIGRGGEDADGFEARGGQAYGLLGWLAPRVGLGHRLQADERALERTP